MMKTTKKLMALLLALAMALSCLTACSKTTVNESTGAQTEEATEPSDEPSTENTEASTEDTEPSTEENYDGQLVSDGEMELDYAENFSIELYKGGYRMIKGGANEVKMLVVPEGMSVPADLEEDVIVLQMPINNVYMASTGMVSLIDAIDALDHVKLVATDVSGWYLDNVIAKMENGDITYSGSYKEPDYELMTANDIQLHIDTTMLNSYPEVLEKMEELGIPTLIEDSSKEGTPLGRVEWVKLFGVLFGKEAEAEEYFNQQKALVENAAAAGENSGITVAMGYIASTGKCYARNGGDYMAQEIGLAGGIYIQQDMNPEDSGNTTQTFEEWYAAFKDADYLFYVNFALKFNSIQEMIDYNPLFADFKSVQNGNVWITSADFTQSTAAIASIIADMNTILYSEDPEVTTDHLIKLPLE